MSDNQTMSLTPESAFAQPTATNNKKVKRSVKPKVVNGEPKQPKQPEQLCSLMELLLGIYDAVGYIPDRCVNTLFDLLVNLGCAHEVQHSKERFVELVTILNNRSTFN